MEKMKLVEIFSIPHSLEIIFVCENNGHVAEIARRLGLSSTSLIYPALKKMELFEVLESDLMMGRGYRRKFDLTEKGKKVLEKLKEIESLL